MKKFLSALCAAALTASVAVTSVLPANAAPVFVPKAPAVDQSGVIQIRDRSSTAGDGPIWKRRKQRNFRNNNWNGNWNNNWDGNQNLTKYNGPNFGWYNGYKGYTYQRRNYRYHNGYVLWFTACAFIEGAIIGGEIANNYGYYLGGGGSAHVEWF